MTEERTLPSVRVKRRYTSRRKKFIIIVLTISIICIIYKVSLESGDDLDSPGIKDSDVRQGGRIMNEDDLDIQVRQGEQRDPRLQHHQVYRDAVREYIEHGLEEALKETKGSGCEMPQLDPFEKEVMQFVKKYPPIICGGRDWVKCFLSECKVVDEILAATTDVECIYQDIIRVNDNGYYLKKPTTVTGNKSYILDASDHVKIKCLGTHQETMLSTSWIGHSVGFRKSVKRFLPPPGREDTVNVLILGFDSTSKNGFIRQMPKSYLYLTDHLEATMLNGYNIIGDGTTAALLPLLTGKTELELPDVRISAKNNVSADVLPLLFYNLTNDGYRTAYFEDMPQTGTFQFRYNGFQKQPTDHYLRSFFIEESKYGKHRFNQSSYCVGDTPQYQLMMNITDQFFHLDGKRFAFTFIADISHEFSMLSAADYAMLNLLQTLEQRKVFEDTLLIVMADHGPRFTAVRKTLQGKYEERLALMSIRLPEKLKKRRPNAQAALEANANVLITPRDIHATLLDALDWSERMNLYKVKGSGYTRAMSVLKPIPKDRTCSEAGVELHWCACVKWEDVIDNKMVHKAAEEFISYVNKMLDEVRPKCKHRNITEIQSVMRERPNNRMLSFIASNNRFFGIFGNHTNITKENYQLKVMVGPGSGLYEASMTYLLREDRFVILEEGISRINAYGDEPSCISATHPHLNKYCYCRDYYPKATSTLSPEIT